MTALARRWQASAAGGVLLAAALVYARGVDAPTNYDEGVYLASLDALTHGQTLGGDVYASQPPGFYALLRALSLLPGDGVQALRLLFLLIALAGIAAAYALGRRLSGPWGGLAAAALLSATAPYPVQAARVQADTASVALSLCAVAVLVHAGSGRWRHASAGALAGAALSVKLLAIPVAVPIAVLLVARRSWRLAGTLAAGAAAVWLALLVAHANALPELWRSVVADHADARHLGPSLADNAERILLHPLDWRTPAGLLVPVGLVCAALLLRRVEALALGAWVVAAAAFLLYQRPLLDHHLVLLAAVLAVTAGAGLGAAALRLPRPARLVAVALVGLAVAAGLVQEGRRLDRLGSGEPRAVEAAVAELRRVTRPTDVVGADLPIVAYLADRRLPGQLVDTSFVRLGTGSLTDREILVALEHDGARAVVIARLFRERPALLRALEARYPRGWRSDGVRVVRAP